MTDIMLQEVLENTGEKYPQLHSTLPGIKKKIHPYLSQRFFSAWDNALDTSLQSPGARHNPCPTTTMSNRWRLNSDSFKGIFFFSLKAVVKPLLFLSVVPGKGETD